MLRNKFGLIPSQIAKANRHKDALRELEKAEEALKPGRSKSPQLWAIRLHDWSFEHEAVLRKVFQPAVKGQSHVETVSKQHFISVLQALHAPVNKSDLKNVFTSLDKERKDLIKISDFFEGLDYLQEEFVLSQKVTFPLPGLSRDHLPANHIEDPLLYFDEPKEMHINMNQHVTRDHLESLMVAFSRNVPVDIRDCYYKTPLMTACRSGKNQIARFLIALG